MKRISVTVNLRIAKREKNESWRFSRIGLAHFAAILYLLWALLSSLLNLRHNPENPLQRNKVLHRRMKN
jgi:hypothetical protein